MTKRTKKLTPRQMDIITEALDGAIMANIAEMGGDGAESPNREIRQVMDDLQAMFDAQNPLLALDRAGAEVARLQRALEEAERNALYAESKLNEAMYRQSIAQRNAEDEEATHAE